MKSNEERKVTRRAFLRVSALTTLGAGIAACAPATAQPAAVEPTKAPAAAEPTKAPAAGEPTKAAAPAEPVSKYKEAPALADLVKSGKLPPVEQRLPTEPEVVQPLEKVGEYGGTLRTVLIGENTTFHVRNTWGPETFLRIDRDGSTITPGVAKSWEISDDGKEFVFHLREGMKWSDGEPFTAEGLEFWYNDIIMNDEITPAKPVWMKPGGEMMKFEKSDDYTVKFTFAKAYPFLVNLMAHYEGMQMVAMSAKHYMSKTHINYVEKAALEKMMADAKFDVWFKLFNDVNAINNGMTLKNPEMPTVAPFMLREKTASARIFDRNPYYWKVDPEGNQLPYTDMLNTTFVDKGEVANAMVASGKINFQAGFVFTLANYPLYKQNEAAGKYNVRLFKTPESTALALQPNQTCKDEVLRGIFQDVRFRQALSHAIDRDTMNEAVFQGLGVPVQTHVIENSKYYTKEYEEAFIEFNLDKANALLDEMGLDKRDSEDYRLRSDGQRLVINLTYTPSKEYMNPCAELFKEFFDKIGVEVKLESITGELMTARVPANEIDFGMWYADKSSDIIFPLKPMWFVPFEMGWERPWCVEWARWFSTGGKEGMEPTDTIKGVIADWEAALETLDENELVKLGKNILKAQAENLWTIGTVGHLYEPVIVGDNLKNFPEEGYTGYDYLTGSHYRVEQVYFEGGKWTGEA